MSTKKAFCLGSMLVILGSTACGVQDEGLGGPLEGKSEQGTISAARAGLTIKMDQNALAIGDALTFSLTFNPEESEIPLSAFPYRSSCFNLSILRDLDIADELLGEMSDAFDPQVFEEVGRLCPDALSDTPTMLEPGDQIDFVLPFTAPSPGIYHLTFALEQDLQMPQGALTTTAAGATKILVNAHSPLFRALPATEAFCENLAYRYENSLELEDRCLEVYDPVEKVSKQYYCEEYPANLRCEDSSMVKRSDIPGKLIDRLLSEWETAGCSRLTRACD